MKKQHGVLVVATPALIAALLLGGCAGGPAKPAVKATPQGEQAFKNVCAMCHVPGLAGAPIYGKKEDWAARIEQGMDVLYKHAIMGYVGSKGMMPPKGGQVSMPDADVKAAVDYMVAGSM